jgi:hypothetical protein
MSLLAPRLQALQVLVDRLLELGGRADLTLHRPATPRALAQLEKAWKAPLPGSLKEWLLISNGLEVRIDTNDERAVWSIGSAQHLGKREPLKWKRARLGHLGVDVSGAPLSVVLTTRSRAEPPLRIGELPGPTLSAFLDREVARLEGIVARLNAVQGFQTVSLQNVTGKTVGFAQVKLAPGSSLNPLLSVAVEELALSGLAGHDLTPLGSMPTLRRLELRFEGAAAFPRLAVAFPTVRRLTVSLERLEDLSWLERFPAVRHLELRVASLPRALDLSWCTLDHLCVNGFFFEKRQTRALQRLDLPKGLRLLELKSLDLDHLPTLTGADGLEELVVFDQQLSSLTVPQLPRLKYLLLGGNGLTALTGLERAPAVTRLGVSRNRLQALEVEALTALQHLDASENELTRVPRLPPSVVEVDLHKNRLRSFEALHGLGRDVTVDLRGNGLSPIARLEVSRAVGEGPILRWLDED